jgi:uncharacterized membrane protein YeaQ/YmgE (transglycosylase-associated protein family)
VLAFIVYLVVIGFIVGLIARAIVPGNDAMGIGATILLGIAGSFVGGFLLNVLFRPDGPNTTNEVATAGWLGSILGAILVLFLYRAATGSRGMRV